MSNAEVKKTYHENGNIYSESCYLDGKYHREDGPAFISYFMNGNVCCEFYYIMGERHRESGPAYICYDENGNIHLEEYYINGKVLTREKWYSRLSTEQKVNLLFRKGNE